MSLTLPVSVSGDDCCIDNTCTECENLTEQEWKALSAYVRKLEKDRARKASSRSSSRSRSKEVEVDPNILVDSPVTPLVSAPSPFIEPADSPERFPESSPVVKKRARRSPSSSSGVQESTKQILVGLQAQLSALAGSLTKSSSRRKDVSLPIKSSKKHPSPSRPSSSVKRPSVCRRSSPELASPARIPSLLRRSSPVKRPSSSRRSSLRRRSSPCRRFSSRRSSSEDSASPTRRSLHRRRSSPVRERLSPDKRSSHFKPRTSEHRSASPAKLPSGSRRLSPSRSSLLDRSSSPVRRQTSSRRLSPDRRSSVVRSSSPSRRSSPVKCPSSSKRSPPPAGLEVLSEDESPKDVSISDYKRLAALLVQEFGESLKPASPPSPGSMLSSTKTSRSSSMVKMRLTISMKKAFKGFGEWLQSKKDAGKTVFSLPPSRLSGRAGIWYETKEPMGLALPSSAGSDFSSLVDSSRRLSLNSAKASWGMCELDHFLKGLFRILEVFNFMDWSLGALAKRTLDSDFISMEDLSSVLSC
ncbi:serine/arginine repetitive matrix protein 1-like [Macrobrachium rosenbergii]|uniref:serine/arginine repetitive matrix protein 1-like n=1 Tax=Macrobrachium rosenbergii TaxID=79674 RepID=UPI0034D41955